MEGGGVRGRSKGYYAVLGVRRNSSLADVRSAYRKLALKWHPDRWTGGAGKEAAEEAKRRFQRIQEAYQVLFDGRKRALYDAGLYNSDDGDGEEDVEGFAGFVQEMVTLMASVSREQKVYSLEELQRMLADMAGEFDLADATQHERAPGWESRRRDDGFPKGNRCDVAGISESPGHLPRGAHFFQRQKTAY